MNDVKEQAAAQLEEHREYLESRKFHLFDTLALRVIEGGTEVIICDPRWRPYTSVFPNDYLWQPAVRFDDPVQAYLYAELAGWGRV